MNRHKLMESVAKFFLRSARGQGLVQKVIDPVKDVLDGTVYLFALKGLLNISVPFYAVIIIVAIKKSAEVVIGWLDESIGFWKAENFYQSYELNRFNQEVMTKLNSIEEKVKKL